VLAGSIAPQGTGYALAMKVLNTVTGTEVATVNGRASNKDGVLPAAMRLIASVRTALGDEAPESEQMLKMTSLSVQSLDAVRHYAVGMDAQSNNRFEEARQNFAKAVEIDPKFGLGYSSLAGVSRNLGLVQDAEKYTNEALRYLDGMTERERFSTRGFYYRLTGDFQLCVKEYGELVTRYAADVVGRNQRALCMSKLRDLKGAVDEIRYVVNMLPNRPVFRDNLALYSNYAGDFATAEKEARTVGESDAYSLVALALAQTGQNQNSAATETYRKLRELHPRFASMAESGLADIAALEGRYADAVAILNEAVAQDLAAKSADRAANKLSAIAFVELARGRKRAAVDAADKALATSQAVKIRFMTARTFIEAGELTRAKPLVDKLVSELQAEPQAYGKILEGQLALKSGDARQAIKVLTEANALIDTWVGHFELGRAYLEAGALIQADSEFDRCIKRRGEALSLFLDEDPNFAHFPPVFYYQGRVREGLKNAGFTESYKAYLAFRGESQEDPLVADARRRAGS
jgi:tetratricopeptide (TPR) repeat protein